MLNKLLKRCMPWMDKGRWYHFRVTQTLDGTVTMDYDNIFSRFEVVTGEFAQVNLYFANNEPRYKILFWKIIPNYTDPEITNYVTVDSDVISAIYSEEKGWFIPLYPIIGSIDYWLYIVKG